MRPIKFRGRDLVSKMRFGYYVMHGGYPYIIEDGVWFEVDPDSVAQLVGVDCDGNEVYEGDKVISEYGDEIVVRLMDNLPPKSKLKEDAK